jgi:hypothetical protein
MQQNLQMHQQETIALKSSSIEQQINAVLAGVIIVHSEIQPKAIYSTLCHKELITVHNQSNQETRFKHRFTRQRVKCKLTKLISFALGLTIWWLIIPSNNSRVSSLNNRATKKLALPTVIAAGRRVGDIGTSPCTMKKEVFQSRHPLQQCHECLRHFVLIAGH